tara:strand:+ start:180 stop:557 length:378 start_codon:yes stop_codon:yes gene_type:complete
MAVTPIPTIQSSKLDDILKGTTLDKIEFEHLDEFGAAIDLSGATISCQFRQKKKTGKIAVSLNLNGGLTLSGAGNNIVEIDEITEIDWNPDIYFYDIKIYYTATGITRSYVEGTMRVNQNTTNNG